MAAAAGIRLGKDATANKNSASYVSPTWVGLPTKDVTYSLEMEKGDATTRASSGVKQQEPTIIGLTFETELLEVPADTTFEALRTAFFARTVVDMLFSSGASAGTGENAIRADCKITGFKKSEPLNGINVHTVTFEPCYSLNPVVTTALP